MKERNKTPDKKIIIYTCTIVCLLTLHIYLSMVYLPAQLVSIRLSVYPSIHLSIYRSIHISIYTSIHLSIYPSIHLCIYPSSIHLSFFLSYLSIYLSIYLFVCLSACLPACLPGWLAVCLSVCLCANEGNLCAQVRGLPIYLVLAKLS